MAYTIGEIKKILNDTKVQELPGVMDSFLEDGRAGVIRELEKARLRYEKYQQEVERTYKLSEYERKYGEYTYICGIDEVGRGPLAGPVVAGAVILPKDCDILYINDSKKLTEKKREELYDIIMEKAIATGIGYACVERIDEINILPRGVTPRPRSGAAAESARLQRCRNGREVLPKSEVRGSGQEELHHVRGQGQQLSRATQV